MALDPHPVLVHTLGQLAYIESCRAWGKEPADGLTGDFISLLNSPALPALHHFARLILGVNPNDGVAQPIMAWLQATAGMDAACAQRTTMKEAARRLRLEANPVPNDMPGRDPEGEKEPPKNALMAAYIAGIESAKGVRLKWKERYDACVSFFGKDSVQDDQKAFEVTMGRWFERFNTKGWGNAPAPKGNK